MVSNTLCPKMGITQWTCTYKECTCHLKEKIEEDLRGGCHLIWLANGDRQKNGMAMVADASILQAIWTVS